VKKQADEWRMKVDFQNFGPIDRSTPPQQQTKEEV
jgi:hypothetical protein